MASSTLTRTGGFMKFECDSCHAQYMIADEKVGKRGVKVKCKKCQHVIIVRPDRAEAEAAKNDAAKSAAKDEAAAPEAAPPAPPVERPQETLAQPPPPGLDFSGAAAAAAAEGDTFASGGPTDPGLPAMQAHREEPPPPPAASSEGDSAFGSSDARPSDPEVTGPGNKPAPISLFGGSDATQLTRNPLEPEGQQSVPDEPRPSDRTELAQPPQMTMPPPPEARPEATLVAKQELPPPSEPASPPAAPLATTSGNAEDELGDVLSNAFGAMFTQASSAPVEDTSSPDENRGPTRILDTSAMDALRKQTARPDPNELEPGLVAVRRDEMSPSNGHGAAGADDGPPEQVWHCAIDDQDVGPLSLAEVGRHIEAGRVDRETLVWKIGMDDWIPAADVPSVRALFDKVPMPRIPRLEDEAPSRSSRSPSPSFDMGPPLDDLPGGGSPFDQGDDDPSWRPHGLTDVYQAANLAEAAIGGGGGGGIIGLAASMSGPNKAPSMSAPPVAAPMSAASSEPEWRPGAASALASLVNDEIKRIDNGPPPATDDDLAPADDNSINAPLFNMGGGMGGGLGKDIEAGPEVSDPIPRASRPPTSINQPAYEPPPSYQPPQPFLSTPPQQQGNKLSPQMMGLIGGAVAIVLLIVVLVAVFAGKDDKGPKIVLGPDGKPYMMGPDDKLIPLGANEATEKKDDEKKVDESKPDDKIAAKLDEKKVDEAKAPDGTGAAATGTPPADGAAAAPTDPAANANTAEKLAAVNTNDTRKAEARPKPPKPDPKPEPPKVESKPTPKGCDPVLDFDCKPGAAAASSGGAVKDSLAKTDVLLVVKNNMGKVEACGRKTKTSGIIKMSWKIQPSGKTSDVQVADSKFAGTPAGTCVASEIKNWKFPASKATTPVSFPMKLGG